MSMTNVESLERLDARHAARLRTLEWLHQFERNALVAERGMPGTVPEGVDPALFQVSIDAMRAKVGDLRRELFDLLDPAGDADVPPETPILDAICRVTFAMYGLGQPPGGVRYAGVPPEGSLLDAMDEHRMQERYAAAARVRALVGVGTRKIKQRPDPRLIAAVIACRDYDGQAEGQPFDPIVVLADPASPVVKVLTIVRIERAAWDRMNPDDADEATRG